MQCSCLFSACMSISQYNVLVLDLVPVAATGGGGAAPDAMNCNHCITGFPDTPQRLAHMATSIGAHQSKHFLKKITKNTRSEVGLSGTISSTRVLYEVPPPSLPSGTLYLLPDTVGAARWGEHINWSPRQCIWHPERAHDSGPQNRGILAVIFFYKITSDFVGTRVVRIL